MASAAKNPASESDRDAILASIDRLRLDRTELSISEAIRQLTELLDSLDREATRAHDAAQDRGKGL